jgi:hypothetical protein
MSSYESSTTVAVLTPTNAELLSALLTEQLGSPSSWISSTQIRTLRDELAAAVRTPSCIGSLLRSPVFSLAGFDTSVIASAKASLSATGIVPPPLLASLTGGIEALEGKILGVERKAISILTQRALVDLGFKVRSLDSATATAIEARRGHTVMLTKLENGGGQLTDWLGHGGSDCEADMAAVALAKAAHGIHSSPAWRIAHGSTEGGTLFEHAGRLGDGDLLVGVLTEDAPSAGGQPLRSSQPLRLRA